MKKDIYTKTYLNLLLEQKQFTRFGYVPGQLVKIMLDEIHKKTLNANDKGYDYPNFTITWYLDDLINEGKLNQYKSLNQLKQIINGKNGKIPINLIFYDIKTIKRNLEYLNNKYKINANESDFSSSKLNGNNYDGLCYNISSSLQDKENISFEEIKKACLHGCTVWLNPDSVRQHRVGFSIRDKYCETVLVHELQHYFQFMGGFKGYQKEDNLDKSNKTYFRNFLKNDLGESQNLIKNYYEKYALTSSEITSNMSELGSIIKNFFENMNEFQKIMDNKKQFITFYRNSDIPNKKELVLIYFYYHADNGKYKDKILNIAKQSFDTRGTDKYWLAKNKYTSNNKNA